MNMVDLFLAEFWPTFLIAILLLASVCIGRVVSLGAIASSVGPKSFPELGAFTKGEQVRLLHEADRKAYRGWRLLMPAVGYSALISLSFAAGQTLRKGGWSKIL